MIRLFFFLVGYFCLVIGFTDLVLYLNLLTMGYTFWGYLRFVFLGYPGLLIFLGFVLISMTIFKKGRKNNENYL